MHARRPISQHLLVVAAATVATASAVAAAAGCRQEATTNERASERAARRERETVIDRAAKSRAAIVTQSPTPVQLTPRKDIARFFFLFLPRISRSGLFYMFSCFATDAIIGRLRRNREVERT